MQATTLKTLSPWFSLSLHYTYSRHTVLTRRFFWRWIDFSTDTVELQFEYLLFIWRESRVKQPLVSNKMKYAIGFLTEAWEFNIEVWTKTLYRMKPYDENRLVDLDNRCDTVYLSQKLKIHHKDNSLIKYCRKKKKNRFPVTNNGFLIDNSPT